MTRIAKVTMVLTGLLLHTYLFVPAGTAMANGRDLVNDGSFELGPPPDSAWTEVANAPCERIGDHSGDWYVSAYDGSNDYWAAGVCYDDDSGLTVPVTGSVTQTVQIPTGTVRLSFYYITYRPINDDDPVDGDRVYVAVNSAELWSLPLTQANNTYPNWAGPVQVDISAYEGQTVELEIGGVSVGDATGNARIDYVELLDAGQATEIRCWSAVKAVYR